MGVMSGKGLKRQLRQQWLHRIAVVSKAISFWLQDLQINIIKNKYINATTSRNLNRLIQTNIMQCLELIICIVLPLQYMPKYHGQRSFC